MLETPHVIIAAAIAYKIGNPALSLPLALGSHFILEKVPHWNPHLNTEKKMYGRLTSATIKIIVLDTLLALLLGIFIALKAYPDINRVIVILFACFLGALPDIAEAPYFLWNRKTKILEQIVSFQKSIQNDTSFVPGTLTQIITVAAGFWWVFN